METTSLTIDLDSLENEVKLNLSVYGKRKKDSQGSILFGSVTTSSAENSLLDQYTKKGLEVFLGEMAPIVTGENNNNILTLMFHADRVNASKKQGFELNLKNFVVNYVLMKAFEVSGLADERKEAEVDMQRHLDAATKLIFTKDAPSASGKTLRDMTGAIYNDDGTPFMGII